MFKQPEFIAIVVFILLMAVGWLIYQKSKTEFNWLQFFLLGAAKCFTKFLWRTTYVNKMPEGAKLGAIIVCNHSSGVDPFFVQVCCKRTIRWMVAKEYCEHRVFGPFLRACEVISVNRGGIDTAATKTAIRHAEQGGLLGMFPEGRLNMSEHFMLPVRPGAVLVALSSGKPLLPCYIEGSPTRGTALSSFFMTAKVKVSFGELIDVSRFKDQHHDKEVIRNLMRDVLKEIARLAGKDDFEPVFAGRKWKPSKEEVQALAEEKRLRELSQD